MKSSLLRFGWPVVLPAILASNWVRTVGFQVAPSPNEPIATRIHRIETDFAPVVLVPGEAPVKLDLQQLMRISNITEMSVAVIDKDKVDWAKGYGVTDRGAPVTTHTLFPASSVSKPISAIAALQLVDQGKVSLDEDVNNNLKTWHVPENEFTKEQKVTLRRIMTHTAGTTVHGFYGYEVGKKIPTLEEILKGKPPAVSDPVTVDFVPGTKQRYSGGGFLVMQQLVSDVTGKPFELVMRDSVFLPLGVKDSTYDQSLAEHAASRATGRDNDGEVVPMTIYPDLGSGGLWTTASDLGRLAIEVARAKAGKPSRLLSQSMAEEMLKPQTDPNIGAIEGPKMRMGLGWELGDESDPGQYKHSGINTGFYAEVFMWDSGHGVVVMINNWSFESQCAVRYLINNIAKEYGWKFRYSPYTPWPYADTLILAAAKLRGVQPAIAEYYALKKEWSDEKRNGLPLKVTWTSNPPDFPPSEWDLFGIAHVLAHPKHLGDAIALMKAEVSDYPSWAPGHQYLGELYERAGKKEPAIQEYETVLKLNPKDEDAGAALKRLGAAKD